MDLAEGLVGQVGGMGGALFVNALQVRLVLHDALGLLPQGPQQLHHGLAVGASLEDLGKGLRSQIGTMFGTVAKGPRYLEMAEGYCSKIALNKDDEIVGYEFINFGKMMDFIKGGDDANTAFEKAKGQYGRVADAVKIVDPRKA